MTTSHLRVIEGDHGESLTNAVARRLRGQLGELQISAVKLADMTGLKRSSVGRRLSGETALDTSELEVICAVTGISLVYLMTGERMPGGPGTHGDGWAPRGSNPEPTGNLYSQVRQGDSFDPLDTDYRHAA